MINKKVKIMTSILILLLATAILGACGSKDSKKINVSVTVGDYNDTSEIVRLEEGDEIEDIQDMGEGWVKFKNNGKELCCPKDKLERSLE